MKNWKDNISFVLVEPQEPGNVGSSARALKNMGFRRLSLVNPVSMNDEASRMAHNALDIIGHAPVHPTLADAIQDKSIIVGATRRKGRRRGIIYNVDEASQKIRQLAASNKVAILFGREDRGLYNEEVEECGFLLSIPANKEHPSINLAQAVLIVAYEISRAEYRQAEPDNQGAPKLVSHDELTKLYCRISDTLMVLEYFPRGDRDIEKKIMVNLKHFIGRAGITGWECRMLHGICTRIERKLKGLK
jgi:TrmH family RNA methyltransferase